MKQMSQESSFSDVQLEDPDARRNSNSGPSHRIAEPVFLFPPFISLSFCPCLCFSVTVILPDGTLLNCYLQAAAMTLRVSRLPSPLRICTACGTPLSGGRLSACPSSTDA